MRPSQYSDNQRFLRRLVKRTVPGTLVLVAWAGLASSAFAMETEQNLPCRMSDFKGPQYAKLATVQKHPALGRGGEYLVSWESEAVQQERSEKDARLSYESGEWVERPVSGARFEIARCLPTGRWVAVGQGVAGGRSGRLVDGTASAIKNVAPTSPESERELAQSGNLYWRPMVGDVVMPIRSHISNSMRITPKMQYAVGELFERNSNGSFSFDLSDEGRQKLRENFRAFKSVNGRLMIEGVAQKRGSRSELRLQSQIRAKAVAQFLARDFKIEPEKIVTVGYGSEGMPMGFAPVAQWPELDMSESITLRVMPL